MGFSMPWVCVSRCQLLSQVTEVSGTDYKNRHSISSLQGERHKMHLHLTLLALALLPVS